MSKRKRQENPPPKIWDLPLDLRRRLSQHGGRQRALFMVQQQEMQARYTQSQSNAAHRLNVLAAIFLPVAIISSVFGMNLPSGLESSQFMFWITFVLSMFLGGVIGFFVMNVRQVKPAGLVTANRTGRGAGQVALHKWHCQGSATGNLEIPRVDPT